MNPRRSTDISDANSQTQSEFDSTKDENDLNKIYPGKYGWGRFTPSWLQIFNKPQWLLTVFCCAVFSSTLAGALMPAITATLERRFHMNSVQSGLLNSSYDIASLLIVLFVCHYGERGHKGKWIGVGAIVYGIGSCILTIPHYVGEAYRPTTIDYFHNATCPSNYPQDICMMDTGATTAAKSRDPGYSYYILLLGQSVRGFGGTCLGTLMLSYIDENVAQRSSPMYLSILSVVGLVAMALGFLSGGELLHLYGDFDRVPKDEWPSQNDPNWYGCWWLGYYIAGISAFLISIPLLGFPKELPNKIKARQLDQEQAHDEKRVTGTGFGQNWSEIPRATWSLLKNPVFTCFTLRTTVEVMFGSGWSVFMPKFLQNMYGMDPGFSAMVAGLICLGPIMIGTLFGGWIIKRFNWKVRGVLFFGFLGTLIGSFCCLGILFMCKTRHIAGANVDYRGNIIPKDTGILWDQCNRNCSCLTTDYVPVCLREAGITYYSPCFAGCTDSERRGGGVVYTNCECIKSHFPSLSTNDSVVNGECPQGEYCVNQRNWFIGTWVITCLFYGMSGMPLVQSFLRAVPFSQRTLALGLQSIPLRMLGTVPGPIIMGLMFDYSCVLWRTYCDNKLSCLHYDNETIVKLLVYTGIAWRTISGALLVIAIVLYRPPKQKSTSASYGGAFAATDQPVIAGDCVSTGMEAALNEETCEGSILDTWLDKLRRRIRSGKPC